MIPLKKNLTDDGLSLLLHQFGEKTNIKALLKSYLDDWNSLDNDTFNLVGEFGINEADGYLLDYVGAIVGESRNLDADDVYRDRIKLRVLINTSEGTPNDLLEITSEITNTPNVRIWEHYPVSFMLYTDGNNATALTVKGLKQASPATGNFALIVDTTQKGFFGTELVANYNEIEKRHLFAELLEQFDFLIDNSGNNIVDENNNFIILYSGGGNTVSPYGVLTEVLS